MHPSDTTWWRTHTGDYVLGLLSDPDRLVLERIIQVDSDVARMVVEWREQLQPMSDALNPIEPPEHIIASLVTNLPEQPEPSSASGALVGNVALADEKDESPDAATIKLADQRASVLADGTAFQRMIDQKQRQTDGWRSYAGWATVVCVFGAMSGWIGLQKYQALNTDHDFDAISIVEDTSATPLWIVDSSSDAKVLRATAINPPEIAEGKAFELWINKSDSSVVSMGLLPTQTNTSVQFGAHKFDPESEAYSVSLEPSGGAKQALPTGPVLYRGLIQRLQTETN